MSLRTFAPSSDERVIAGVCAGIAQTLGVDATLVRLVFALLALAGGAGILLYLALWAWARASGASGSPAVLALVAGGAPARRTRSLRPVGRRDRADRGRARARLAPGRQLPAGRAALLRRARARGIRGGAAALGRRHVLDAARARRRRRRAAPDRRPVGVAARARAGRRAHRAHPQRGARRTWPPACTTRCCRRWR